MAQHEFKWTPAADAALDIIFDQAEKALAAQVAVSVATMQRATTLVGIFGAGSLALLGAGIAQLHVDAGMAVGAFAGGCGLLVAAVLAAQSARPADLYSAGYDPYSLVSTVTDTQWLRRHILEDLQRRIDVNAELALAGGRWIEHALWAAPAGLAIGAVIAVIAKVLR